MTQCPYENKVFGRIVGVLGSMAVRVMTGLLKAVVIFWEKWVFKFA